MCDPDIANTNVGKTILRYVTAYCRAGWRNLDGFGIFGKGVQNLGAPNLENLTAIHSFFFQYFPEANPVIVIQKLNLIDSMSIVIY